MGFVALPIAWVVLVATTPTAFQGSSVNDGVYSEEQAARGAATYTKECSSCHGEGLGGDGFAPALTGPEFLGNWNGTSIGDLFDRVRVSMPPSNPAAVSAQSKADIIAHVLKSNKYPAGKVELAKDVEPLKQIKFDLPK
jgi:mono/diheme cytochrome c family protein